MENLKKRFISEDDSLQAFVNCSCPAAGCNCDPIYNPSNMASSIIQQQEQSDFAETRNWA